MGALPDAEKELNAHDLALHSHNIIYRLGEDVRSLVNEKLPPIYVEEVVGKSADQSFKFTTTNLVIRKG